MTQDAKKQVDAEATTEDLKPADPTASELFFGGHLEELVKGTAQPVEPEIATMADAEKTVETSSLMFFGDHLDNAVIGPEAPEGGDPEPPDGER
jgi:hypothetical protein